jgi:hypothetical protein
LLARLDAWNLYWSHGKAWLAYTDIPIFDG